MMGFALGFLACAGLGYGVYKFLTLETPDTSEKGRY